MGSSFGIVANKAFDKITKHFPKSDFKSLLIQKENKKYEVGCNKDYLVFFSMPFGLSKYELEDKYGVPDELEYFDQNKLSHIANKIYYKGKKHHLYIKTTSKIVSLLDDNRVDYLSLLFLKEYLKKLSVAVQEFRDRKKAS